MSNEYDLFGLENDKQLPTGDPSVGYPQICIRTNRTAGRSDFDEVIRLADEAANKYPPDDKEHRAEAVLKKLTDLFGGGSFGHTWVIFFNSDKKGDCTTYGYHRGFGFVKNGTSSDQNDSPDRPFHLQRVIQLTDPGKFPAALENSIIPALNEKSYQFAKAMGMEVENPEKGAYTPINNCAWFAGNL